MDENSGDFPTVEEIKREMEALKRKYGDNIRVSVFSDTDFSEGVDSGDKNKKDDSGAKLHFDHHPKDIKLYLDRHVIQQHEAKKALAIAVCDHYNHVKACVRNPKLRDEEYTKQNVIVIGPTGVGKTYLVRTIAKLIGVPFVKADATKFSETGYVGGNVEDLVRDLVSQADGDTELASYGIIYLDEVDKIAGAERSSGRDVSGRGVQMGLLKLMEETDIDTRSPFDIQGQLQALMEQRRSGGKPRNTVVNTRHILFIVSGAFNGLSEVIQKRIHQTRLGFGAEIHGRDSEFDYFHHATSEDFIQFGFEPEFIGRLPIHVSCQKLSVEDLFHVLKYSAGSIIRQYRRAFEAYGIEVHFADEGLREIAAMAHRERTGARGLVTVCERLLRDYKFELSSSHTKCFVVTRQLVKNPKDELARLLEDPTSHEPLVELERLQHFGIEQFRGQGVRLIFDEKSAARLSQLARDQALEPTRLAAELFASYQHGLPLLKKSTGQVDFYVDVTAVEDPDGTLERWVRESYAKNQGSARGAGRSRVQTRTTARTGTSAAPSARRSGATTKKATATGRRASTTAKKAVGTTRKTARTAKEGVGTARKASATPRKGAGTARKATTTPKKGAGTARKASTTPKNGAGTTRQATTPKKDDETAQKSTTIAKKSPSDAGKDLT